MSETFSDKATDYSQPIQDGGAATTGAPERGEGPPVLSPIPSHPAHRRPAHCIIGCSLQRRRAGPSCDIGAAQGQGAGTRSGSRVPSAVPTTEHGPVGFYTVSDDRAAAMLTARRQSMSGTFQVVEVCSEPSAALMRSALS